MVKFKGINHLAMVTGDMEKTVKFYRDVLGMSLVATTGNRPGLYPYRHYFFALGNANTIAFFEWPGMVEEFHKPAGAPTGGRVQFDHVSFNVESEGGPARIKRKTRTERGGCYKSGGPSNNSLHLFHRPQRHRSGGQLLAQRSHRPGARLRRPRAVCRP